MNVEELDRLVIGLVLARVDAVDRTHVDTGRVFGADAGLGDDVRHIASFYMQKSGGEMADTCRMLFRPPGRQRRAALAAVVGCALGLSCSGDSSKPTEPTNPTPTNTIIITASGVSPKDILIAPGTRVLFQYNDSRSHNMS